MTLDLITMLKIELLDVINAEQRKVVQKDDLPLHPGGRCTTIWTQRFSYKDTSGLYIQTYS
jgi:hypothetical protein